MWLSPSEVEHFCNRLLAVAEPLFAEPSSAIAPDGDFEHHWREFARTPTTGFAPLAHASATSRPNLSPFAA
jgi:hypothetical protein